MFRLMLSRLWCCTCNPVQCKGVVRNFSSSIPLSRQRLVILGTGWGSYSVLKHIDKKLFDVIVVSPRNHFLFTPLLCSTTVGTLEFRSIIEPVRNTGFRDEHHFQLAEAIKLCPEQREITCRSTLNEEEIKFQYDKLVIGVGAVSNTFGVPGVYENAFFLKEIADARKIRNQILKNFELAMQPGIDEDEKKRLLHFVIVGGGPTGVEFGAELYDFVKQDVARLYAHEKENVRVTLIEAQHILPSFDEKLRQFAERKMRQRNQFKLLQSSVTEVHKDGVTLKDGTRMPCSMVVWSTGLAPRDFTASLNLPKNKSQQLVVDGYLKIKGQEDYGIFALGDCSFVESHPYPCTAQVAERQGQYLAKSLTLYATGRQSEVQEFSWINLGMLAYVGGYQGLADFPTGKLQGFKSWIVWRSVYLTKLGSWRGRFQVPFDWARTFFFGRDISQF
ncbi:probable NADH dehydrogenase [Exaiptasia diaphana]|uniref:FAD/NAD(P)-binding domain-containing protein n=1 Tax=Exaiptasia diaphana TaxID=2652724 RepID=A0A913WYQ3_EXADI|nr:probable NADH dehydrogenase [Exaiptasia diaphana]KXJ16728.1 putative NADH dehydrogenase [Exaiptasia diaphana]